MADKPNRTPTSRSAIVAAIAAGGMVDLPMETRAAPISTIDADSRTIEVCWTTGAAGPRIDWFTGERYIEELVVTDKAVRLGRLNAGAPVLDSHRAYNGLASMLAVVERAWIDGGKGLATIRFPKAEDDPEADRVFRKVSDGIIRSLSVGYRRNKIEVDKTKEPKVWRVVDWEPFEISFVPVPFDIAAQVRDDKAPTWSCEFLRDAASASATAGALARMRMRMRQAGLEHRAIKLAHIRLP